MRNVGGKKRFVKAFFKSGIGQNLENSPENGSFQEKTQTTLGYGKRKVA